MKHLKLFEDYIDGKNYSKYQIKTLDELLDKVSKSGYDSLTDEEKENLSKFDTLTQPEPEVQEIEEIDTPTNVNKKYFDKTKQIAFLLKDVSEDKKEVYYEGTIYFKGVEYNGYFSKDKNSEAPYYTFTDKNGNDFEPSNYDLHYEFDDLVQSVFYDEQHNDKDTDEEGTLN